MKNHTVRGLGVLMFLMMVGRLIAGTPAKQATIVVLGNKEPTFAVPWREQAEEALPNMILLEADTANVEGLDILLVALTYEDGTPIPLNVVEISPTNVNLLPLKSILKVSVTLKSERMAKPGTYKGTLRIGARNAKATEITMVLRRAGPKLETAPAAVGLRITRILPLPLPYPFPFGECYTSTYGTWSIGLRETSGNSGLNHLSVDADPFVETDKNILVPGKLEFQSDSVIQPNGQLAIGLAVKGLIRTGEFNTNIRIHAPGLKEPFVVPLKIVMTDLAFFPFIAICLGVGLSYCLTKWTGQLQRLTLARAIAQLEAEISADTMDPNVRNELKATLSEASNDLSKGDRSGAETKLKEVEKKYHDFKTKNDHREEVQGTLRRLSATFLKGADPGTPKIGCVEVPQDWEVGRVLTFVVNNKPAAWGDNTRYQWSFDDGSKTEDKDGKEGLEVRHAFYAMRTYEVMLTVTPEGLPSVAPLQFQIAIKQSRVDALAKRISKIENGISVLTLLLASLTGLIALYFNGKPFGSLQDYVVAFLWGFGLDASVKGISAVRSRLGLGA